MDHPRADDRVRAGEVDVLEDAALRLRGQSGASAAVLVDDEQPPARSRGSPPRRRSAAPRSPRRRPTSVEPAQRQRADAVGSRAAYRVCSSMKTKQKAPRSRGSTSNATASSDRSGSESSAVTSAVSVVLPRPISPGMPVQLAVPLGDQLAQLGGVDEVAIVGQGDRRGVGAAEGGLGVLPGRPAGRGVPAVADRHMPAQRLQRGLVEDLGDQPHVPVDEHLWSRPRWRSPPTPRPRCWRA